MVFNQDEYGLELLTDFFFPKFKINLEGRNINHHLTWNLFNIMGNLTCTTVTGMIYCLKVPLHFNHF